MTTHAQALIIVDMQKGMQDTALPSRNNPLAEANMLSLLGYWRTIKQPIVHVRHISRSAESVFRPGQIGAEFQDALLPLAGEHVMEKNVPDAFTHSSLERWLRVRDIERVVIVGVSTNNSVESTARSAGNLGFRTAVVADATFAFARVDLDGTHRSAEEVHRMSLNNLSGEYAQIVSTADLLARSL
jgi:nicotinamidase-related amidase